MYKKMLIGLLAIVITMACTYIVFAKNNVSKPIKIQKVDKQSKNIEVKKVEKPKKEEPVKKKSLGIFIATAYCPCKQCSNQWGKSIAYPCDGSHKAIQGHTVGADKDVLPMGSVITLWGKDYVVEDVGGGIKGNRLDVYFDSHEDAVAFGVREVEVFVNGE